MSGINGYVGFMLSAAGESAPENRVVVPLTYDEADYAAALTWTRLGAGPRITGSGLLGDGFTARLRAPVPTWANTASQPLTLSASATIPYDLRHTTRDTIVHIGNNDATANPKLELCVIADSAEPNEPNTAVRCYTGAMQTKALARRNWAFGVRHPELIVSGWEARPQGIHFLDATTMLVCAHYEDNLARVHKMTTDGTILGYFDFDPLDSAHINSITAAADGSIWMSGGNPGYIFEVDVDASLLSNEAVILTKYDVGTAVGAASYMDIATISGTEYVLVGLYATSGTPYIYVFPKSLVTHGGTFNAVDRTNRYVTHLRTQGIVYSGGKLYTTANRKTSGSVYGWVFRYPALNLAATDGSTLIGTEEISVLAPSEYPEDLAVHPTTGRIWCAIEGRSAVGSDDGWLSYWHSDLVSNQENHYTFEYDGASTVTIKINGQLFEAMSWTPTVNPATISIGGPPAATEGQQNGFFIGTVRNVLIQDEPLSDTDYSDLIAGSFESGTLTTIPITLTNPGGETLDLSGWTNEVGTFALGTSGPHSGVRYFFGTGAAVKARQRIDLVAASGLTGTQIDAGGLWAIVDWWQSSFTDTDSGTMGLRFLDGSSVQISENLPTNVDTNPSGTWIPRSYGISIPSGTRYIDVLYNATRVTGTNLDCYVDDIALTIYRQ